MIRQFELINEYGQNFGLNDVRKGALLNPQGFGYAMEYSYVKIGAYWKEQYIKDSQGTIEGNIIFGSASPYEAQSQFLEFLRVSKSLALKRTTPAGVHYKDVQVVSYDLSEITEGNVLSCPIKMVSKSLWYVSSSQRASIISSADDEARYSYRFPSRFNDYADGYLDINNTGSVPASFEVEFYGTIVNPVITLEVAGEANKVVSITVSAAQGERVIYSSRDGNLYCFKGTDAQIAEFRRSGSTTGMTNLALGFSLSNENFYKLPVGASKLHITADSTLENPIIVNIYKYFRAV